MPPRSSRFSPHLVPADRLEALFVGRSELAAAIESALVGTVSEGGARYELLVGPRGMGKSHLVAILVARLARSEALLGRAVVVALSEEEHVASLLDLLARLLRAMPAEEGMEPPEAQAASLRKNPGLEGERRAVHLIAQRLSGRALILALENLDRVFEAMGPGGQKRMRAILQEQGRWSLLASSQTAGPPFHNRDQPFYRMFVERPLEALSVSECRDMLLRLANAHEEGALAEKLATPTGLARVRAIHHLTGGTPRAMAVLFPYLDAETLERLEDAFFELADELTPYFQEQMRARSAGQQAVLEQLAESWRPRTVGELAEATFTSHASTAGQLRHLHGDRLVSRMPLGREAFYEIADPLWRIARAMKRPDRAPTVFVRFLRFWHTREEISARVVLVGEGEGGEIWRQALVGVQGEDEPDEYLRAWLDAARPSMDGGDWPTLLQLSEEAYRRRPCLMTASIRCAAHFAALGLASGLEATADLLDRFGGEGAASILSLLCKVTEEATDHPSDLRDRARGLALALPAESPKRLNADFGLLWDGHAPPEVLDQCAMRVARAITGKQRPQWLIPGLISAMEGHQPAPRMLLVAGGMPFDEWSNSDQQAVVRALLDQGEEALAREALDRLSAGQADPLAQTLIRLQAVGTLLSAMGEEELDRATARHPEWAFPLFIQCQQAATWERSTVLDAKIVRLRESISGRLILPELALALGVTFLIRFDLDEAGSLGREISLAEALSFRVTQVDLPPARVNLDFDWPYRLGLVLLATPPTEALDSPDHELTPLFLRLVAGLGQASLPPFDGRVPAEASLLLACWLHRILSEPTRDLPPPLRLAALLGDQPSPELAAAVGTALWQLALSRATHGRDRRDLAPLLEILRSRAASESPLALIEAALAMPGDLRPYTRLAAPERLAIRLALGQMGKAGEAVLPGLPPEDES